MFTLKLYRNGPLSPGGRTVIVECAGVWINHCDKGVKEVHAFRKNVGVQDEDPIDAFYVGGDCMPPKDEDLDPAAPFPVIHQGNYYGWAVLENAQGKTTEMIR